MMKGFIDLMRALSGASSKLPSGIRLETGMATHNYGPMAGVGPSGVPAAKRAAKKRRNQLRAKGKR